MGLSSCRVWPLHTNFFWRLFRNLNTWLELLSLVLRQADPTLPTHKVFVLVTLMPTDHNCAKLEGSSMLLYLDIGPLFIIGIAAQNQTIIIYWISNVTLRHLSRNALIFLFVLHISSNILLYFKYNAPFCTTPVVRRQYNYNNNN